MQKIKDIGPVQSRRKFDKHGNQIVKGVNPVSQEEVESKIKFRESLEKVLSSKFKPNVKRKYQTCQPADKNEPKIASLKEYKFFDSL